MQCASLLVSFVFHVIDREMQLGFSYGFSMKCLSFNSSADILMEVQRRCLRVYILQKGTKKGERLA
jgi:hypothetical protein